MTGTVHHILPRAPQSQDPRFLETWQFCAGLHGAGETGGDVRVAAMLLGALRGRDAFARLMRAGPYQAGRTLLWLRQELGAGTGALGD